MATVKLLNDEPLTGKKKKKASGICVPNSTVSKISPQVRRISVDYLWSAKIKRSVNVLFNLLHDTDTNLITLNFT